MIRTTSYTVLQAQISVKSKAPRGARTHSLKMTARSGDDRYRSLARYHCASRAGLLMTLRDVAEYKAHAGVLKHKENQSCCFF
jgi:hypothetical protein